MMSPYKILSLCLTLTLLQHAHATDEAVAPTIKTRPIYVAPAITEDNSPLGFTESLELLRFEEPIYSNSLLTAGETKNTTLKILVNNRGEVTEAEIAKSSGVEELDNAAKKAIVKTTFLPYINKNTGQPIHVYTNFVYSFKQHQVTDTKSDDQPKQKRGGGRNKS
ncbi:energy transducer TonB family protein [Aquirhabdus parva]|uniref:TonB family protein n=1 Tax=Aquirhabdus parva TaxID=2283318 RepID=A0A345P520_9GAMM|nr:energy transducer TonB [Aquirhabdus parva]AXI02379.1 TonB family protein [Aquirhabdus parva]